MRVTTKGQVTIPQHIRDKMMITPSTEIDFVEESGRVYRVKKKDEKSTTRKFLKLRGKVVYSKNCNSQSVNATSSIRRFFCLPV